MLGFNNGNKKALGQFAASALFFELFV